VLGAVECDGERDPRRRWVGSRSVRLAPGQPQQRNSLFASEVGEQGAVLLDKRP
jgi:hypothetical protein